MTTDRYSEDTDSILTATPSRQQVWTRYWANGAAHSCPGSWGERYGGAIAAFWRAVHDATPPGSKLLDIATGSGALPRLWRSWRSSDEWDAVDLSDTAPAWARDAGAGLRFHPGVRAEALPLPSARFDLVASQYGLEYCDLALALPELLRVRQPQGRVALVLHHAASRPVTLAGTELDHLDWSLGPEGLVAACAAMLEPVALAQTPQGRERLRHDPAAESVRLRFNAAQAVLRERAQVADGADVLADVQDGVGSAIQAAIRSGAEHARSALDAWVQTLDDHRWRLRELRTHALDEVAVRALADRLAEADLRTQVGTLEEEAHLMGWTVRADPR